MSNVAYGLVTQELERGDSGLRSFVSVQSALVMYPIYAYGSDAQKEKWLPLLQQGTAIGCFGLTEPQFGSNPGGMLTRAVRKGSKYVFNGEKMWITSGSIADIAVVWAKCEDEKIRGFLVEKGTPGFKAWDVHGKWSLRASVTSGLSFTDCEIPAENLLAQRRRTERPARLLESGPLRHRLGRSRRGHGLLRHRAAIRQDAQAIRQQAHRLASARAGKAGLDDHRNREGPIAGAARGPAERQDKVDPSHISMLKMNNVAIALETARKARDILGANGIVDDYPVMRHMNNLESVSTYEGTNDIHKLVIGERITGISAFI